MRGGELRHRVLFEERAPGTNALNEPNAVWRPLEQNPEDWARVRFPFGGETVASNASRSVRRAAIRIRFRSDITAANRLWFNSEVYDIKAARPDDESGRTWLDLDCETGMNDG